MTKFDDRDGYNPQHDNHAADEEREEGFFETLDRVVPDWRRWLLSGAIALPLAAFGIWIFETYIIK